MLLLNFLTGLVQRFDPRVATLWDDELALLKVLVSEIAKLPGPIVEIGTLIGVTTTEIALADQDRHKIITVDNYCWNPWLLKTDRHAATAAQMLRYLVATDRVSRLEMDKREFFHQYKGPAPSLVFLDAWHTYEETKKDILWAQAAGAHVISGHDYSDEFPGVIEAVKEFGGPKRLAGRLWTI
jgi:predicted O-methyltransferase YrrM